MLKRKYRVISYRVGHIMLIGLIKDITSPTRSPSPDCMIKAQPPAGGVI